jgi:hypothetical protein
MTMTMWSWRPSPPATRSARDEQAAGGPSTSHTSWQLSSATRRKCSARRHTASSAAPRGASRSGLASRMGLDSMLSAKKFRSLKRRRMRMAQAAFSRRYRELFLFPALKGHVNEADFLGFLHKPVWHRSLTLRFKPFQFWLRILGDISNRKMTPRLGEPTRLPVDTICFKPLNKSLVIVR